MNTATNAKIRIRLESFNHELLVSSCDKIVNILQNTPLNSIGVITLPTRKRIYCVLRSPHVDKDSREHFELKTYKRIIDIYEPSSQTIDALMKLNLSAGVDIEIKL